MNSQVSNSPWIGGRDFDIVFFFGSSLFAMLLGIFFIAHPQWLAFGVWMSLLFSEGPHLVATWQRTYMDPAERQRSGKLLIAAFWTFGFCFALWGISVVFHLKEAILLLVGLATLWSWYHQLRQNYGVMSIYEAKTKTPHKYWQFDKYFFHAFMWIVLGASALTLPVDKTLLKFSATPTLHALAIAVYVLMTAMLLAYFYSLWKRHREGESLLPAAFVLFSVICLYSFIMFLFGYFEPVLPAPKDDEQLVLGMTMLGLLVHGIQYLGVCIATNRKRYADLKNRSFSAKLGRHPVWFYLFLVTVSLLYIALNGARGAVPGWAIFNETSNTGTFFLAIYWSFFFHHYFLDQFIWRIKKDDSYRQELSLTPVGRAVS
jgi:hypothetical protein